MKVLFVQKDIFVKPAIMLLSAVLDQHGHRCDLLIHELEKDIHNSIRNSEADIIAFSITTSEYPWMNRLGNEIRSSFPGQIICGGPHATFYPEVVNDVYLDAICVGEGVEALIDFVDTLEQGDDISLIRNFSIIKDHRAIANPVRPLKKDINALPFYNRRIYQKYDLYKKKERCLLYYDSVMTGRGCPYSCAFCFNRLYNEMYSGKGEICTRRSPANVIDEIRRMRHSDRDLKFITFIDDVFTLPPRKWITAFLEQYGKDVGLPFRINTRANLLDEDLIRRLKTAGCHSIAIGIESGNERVRNEIYHKHVSNQEITAAAELIKAYGIRFQTFNIIGAPGETLDMAFETYELNRRIQPDFTWCSLLNLYPGTDIYNYSVENDLLERAFNFKDTGNSYFTDTLVKMNMKKEMFHLQKLIGLGTRLQLSPKTMRLLIRLPLSGLYKLIFGAGFFLGIRKMYNANWFVTLKLSILRFARYNK